MRTKFFVILVLSALLLPAISAVSVQAVRTDPATVWQHLLGGLGWEYGYSAGQTADGGYILLGSSTSSVSGNVSGTTNGYIDLWVVKLSGAGDIQWERLLGGIANDVGKSVQQTTDGGYILLGTSASSASGDVKGTNHGLPWTRDLWVVKLNGTGAIQWEKLLGGSGEEDGYAIEQTADGGYILFGATASSQSGDVTGTVRGESDLWVVKLTSTGGIQWQYLYGGSDGENGCSLQRTADGGYILLGISTSSQSGDVSGTNHGGPDLWVVKLTGTGGIQWQQLLGGNDWEFGTSARQTADGGYILLGTSDSSQTGDMRGANHGEVDLWVVKLDGAGNIQWERLLGGSKTEANYFSGTAVRQTADGGYILLGHSYSSASGDVTGTNHGSADLWVVKLATTGAIQWQQLLGGSSSEYGSSIEPLDSGGHFILGWSSSSGTGNVTDWTNGQEDLWVVNLKARVSVLPGGTGMPGDLDNDQKYEDVNGNGRKDFADVVLYFNQMAWIARNEPVAAFDYNRNSRVDFADVVWLFNNL